MHQDYEEGVRVFSPRLDHVFYRRTSTKFLVKCEAVELCWRPPSDIMMVRGN